MGKKVYANGMAIAAKAGSGKLIAAFPDVCNSPPSPPAGPVPLPYPNTSMSKDLSKGTKRVLIGGKPAGLKDSEFKTSPLGDEAATKSFGGSLLSHTITGAACFAAYSMDVKFEGKSVTRHLDLMTSNHASYPGSTPPFTEMEDMALHILSPTTPVECPCCWTSDCTAALPSEFEPGKPREPMSFSEFYRLDEVDGAKLTSTAQQRRAVLSANRCSGGSCPNAGKALPKSDPPCDVYRVLTKAERQRNFDGVDAKGVRDLRTHHGAPPSKGKLAQRELGPFAKVQDLRNAGWTDHMMAREIQLDHTTPRSAGGCPTSETNTAAHSLKCANCQFIDGQLDTWNSTELQERRAALGI